MARPVIFVHGLWLHPTSWQPCSDLFHEAGNAPIAPGWPGDRTSVAEARNHPEALAGHGIEEVTEHHAQIISGLEGQPILVGHSFGGTIVEKLLGQGLGSAGIAIECGPDQGSATRSDLFAEICVPGAEEPCQQEPGCIADGRAVPLPRSGTRSILLNPTSSTPSGPSPLPASRCSKRRPRTSVFTPKPKSTPTILTGDRAPHHGRTRPHRSRSHHEVHPQAIPTFQRDHGCARVPRPRSFPCHRPGLANGRGRLVRRVMKDCDGMEIGVAGKHALVTGASKGIGLAITQALVREGAYLTRLAGTEPRARADVRRLEVQSITVDLSRPAGPDGVAAALGHEPVDILINNVGAVTPRLDGFLAITEEQWARSLTLNLLAATRTTRAALPGMNAARHGTIVTISPVNASLPDPAVMDYRRGQGGPHELLQSPLQRSRTTWDAASIPSVQVPYRPLCG